MTPAEREAIERVRAWSPPYRYQDAYVVLAALDKAEAEIARVRRALIELERWVTDDSDCHTQAQRMAGRKAIIQARAALSPKDGAGE